MSEWCRRQGYFFSAITLEKGKLHTSWQKLDVLLAAAQPEDTNIWIDTDIFILDLDRDISAWFPQNAISFSSDRSGLCAGFFIFQGGWPITFLEFVRWCGPTHTGSHPHYEQDTIKALTRMDSIRERVRLIPTTIVANQESESCPANLAWAYHAWSSNWWPNVESELAKVTASLRLDSRPAGPVCPPAA